MLCFVKRIALLAVVIGALGCGRRAPSDPVSGGLCSERLPDDVPELAAPAPVALPESRISVGAELSVERLKRELSRQVPSTLARARGRNIGTPGEVSYEVRRGEFDVRLDKDRLLVSTPVSAEVEVCKPIGPFCPTYGRCSPRLLSTASVPVVLGKDYDVGRSNVSIALTKSCVIAGFDAAPEIKKLASKEAGGVQRRIDGALPELRPAVEAGWKQLFVPVSLGASTCLRIAPERLAQARPSLSNGTLSARIAVTGRLRVEQPCEPNVAVSPTPLPPLDVEASLPNDVTLEVPIRIAWSEVGAELTRSLAAKDATASAVRIVRATVRGTTHDARSVLALDVTLEGNVCGEARFFAEPTWDSKASRLRLASVRLAPGQPKRAGLLAGAGVERLITERGAIALPVDVSGTPTALEGLVERLTAERPQGVDVAVDVQPARIERVLIDAEALVPIASFRGSALIRVQ